MLEQNQIDVFLNALSKKEGALLMRLSSQEDWLLDDSDDDVYNLVVDLGLEIEQADKRIVLEIGLDQWCRFLSLINLPRAIISLKKLEDIVPNISRNLISDSEESIYQRTLYNRLTTLYRAKMITRIFAEDRAEALLTFMRFYDQKDS